MRYRITIGINHYYLSEEEKEFYLKSISIGQDYVVLKSGKILSKQFMDIVSEQAVKEAENIDLKLSEGRWECDFGAWHYSGNECNCERSIEIKKMMEASK
jgi:hypothetical protein